MGETRGVYALSPDHADAIRSLARDPEIAVAIGISGSPSERDVRDWISAQGHARAEGRAYLFVLSDGDDVVGLCGLTDAGGAEPPRFTVTIDRAHRGTGHAAFAGRRMLELAFQNLQLDRIVSGTSGTSAAWLHVLERLGFEPRPGQAGTHEITRERWRDARARSALDVLHPSLRAILEAELAAGNEVVETSTGWPDPDSVFVRLRHPFRARPAALPEGVGYHESNDPHWWKAEYSSSAPRHVLVS